MTEDGYGGAWLRASSAEDAAIVKSTVMRLAPQPAHACDPDDCSILGSATMDAIRVTTAPISRRAGRRLPTRADGEPAAETTAPLRG